MQQELNNQLPPQNIEAEEAILGGILLDPEAIERVIDILKPEAFYVSGHKEIYRAMQNLHFQNKPTDLLSVTSWLTDKDLLTFVGGRNKLASLIDRTVSATNIDFLAELVVEKYLRRQLIKAGNEIVQLGYSTEIELPIVLDQAEQKVFSIRHQNESNNEPKLLADIGIEVYAELENLSMGIVASGIKTGFYDIDSLTGGFRPGSLIVVAARPGMGKSSFCSQLGLNVSKLHGLATMIFSLEMSDKDIYTRFLSSESKIDFNHLRSGKISDRQWEPIIQAVGQLSEAKVIIDDSSCPSSAEIRSKVRKAIAKYGQLGLVIVDYLQLMVDTADARLPQKIGEITRQLKLLSRECNVPIIIISQLNRDVEGRTNKRPMLSDLRDSGRIEEDADIVMMLYRDDYYNSDSPDRGIAEVIFAKHRNGSTGTVKLLFDSQFTQFKNLARPKNS
ncbi:replicative DNA helicase [Iningainema tapete]|uniref:Replicative DNA helicase n=1 Tax=Iningainema tapete BLCC-T55 TaxID=2748662 RepID=A0A8J7BVW5_9CYAN|nr:replicative DNA helicase [Iningainema tapete]MBD2770672.1 replicative DNA helicase [Iningainema tapete BLCC-T55]